MTTTVEQQITDLRRKSLQIIRENQHESGSFIACPTFPQYHYSWLRDGTYIAYSLLLNGYRKECESFIQWCVNRIEQHAPKVERLPDLLKGSKRLHTSNFLSARYTLEGMEDTSDWPNFQIDGYGSWLWLVAVYLKQEHIPLPRAWEAQVHTVITYLELVWRLPNSDCWEEFADKIHPSTLACLAGGLKAVTPFIHGAFARRSASLEQKITGFILANQHPDGYFPKYIGSQTIDASLIWLSVPYGVISPTHPAIVKTIEKIEREITIEGGVKRYPQDTYYGGGQWIILSAFLGWYYVKRGNIERARSLMNWIIRQQRDDGSLPEQVLEHTNEPSMIQPWEKRWGAVATPLLWSHAMFLILDHEVSVYNHT